MFVPKELTPCQVNDPELWFSERQAKLQIARDFCGSCELRKECLDATIQDELEAGGARFGLYGGLTRAERNRLIKKKKSAS